ncbi:RNA-dependent RNA polymerase [Magnaporthe oryzae ourmia-like virus 4]|uniref:RNA-dependent RNA polymerase n=1 Tax=Magnaporthe oryzae ourmia-like virus 4 TaxID=2600101 RepID=A0A5B8HAF3_9VIRU|nr:RNA-dependent RNA polymerase [Magnaporthe oryzae ourmia-like virus 4]QDW80874.1 RNA-dependent RNA polymerase [Magnaporthe oryzae ourmia-like virus 4]
MVTNWPIKLYWLPYGAPSVFVPLGPVSSSFLLNKRLRRRSQGGCLIAFDVNRQSPPGTGPRITKPVGPNRDMDCKNVPRNGRVARAAVALLSSDQEMERVRPLPPRIRCGDLRPAIRQCFPDQLPVVKELSIKTSQKLEIAPCKYCEPAMLHRLNEWLKERYIPLDPVDHAHIALFKRALAVNVDMGWNKRKYPYIPTGHSTLNFPRGEGGSWNEEGYSPYCRAATVHSNGKPRIVTMYSGRNSEVLSPLHQSLYASLKRKGWLLVGSPTDESVGWLGSGGVYVSVDYKSATDNIRAEYVRAAIDVLKARADQLTEEESRCLDVVGELRFADFTEDTPATRGQPMGSLMSFPLLCLINKTVVDLALVDLAESGKITWEQFRVHRCLINGDDLLYREFDSSRDILAGILRHGTLVGLVVNEEKTMVSATDAEINSTVFVGGRKQKKTNVKVVCWSSDVTDPIGFIADSVVKTSSFRKLLGRWEIPIRKAPRKVQGPLPPSFFKALFKEKRIRDALTWIPPPPPKSPNPFPVVVKPADYCLTREEEVRYISERVARLKSSGYKPRKPARCSTGDGKRCNIQYALRKEKPAAEERILAVLADGWKEKQFQKLIGQSDPFVPLSWGYADWCQECYEHSHSMIQCLTARIRRQKSVGVVPDYGRRSTAVGEPTPVAEGFGDYCSLTSSD